METLWFVVVACMLTAYVVLDGFDLGAGSLHLLLGRSAQERRMIIRAIGPVWDGNEVWLLAAGGTLYFAFPRLYAASFSGFYLPLTMVLWLLILRGVGIEFRAHLDSPLWRQFFDVTFSLSSLLLVIFFGAALGNVIRGVPLNAQGYFFEPLWTTFTVGREPGILDWYTVMTGVVALLALASHGASYIATKTVGELNARARHMAAKAWYGLVVITPLSLAATLYVRPQMAQNYRLHPTGIIIPALVVGSLLVMAYYQNKEDDKWAFAASSLYLIGMLGGAAFGLYPYVLPASTDPALGLTVYNSGAAQHGLIVGLIWWTIGTMLAVGYFVYLYRLFRGKITTETEPEGYN